MAYSAGQYKAFLTLAKCVCNVATTLHLPISHAHYPLHRQSHRNLLPEAIRRLTCISRGLPADAAEPFGCCKPYLGNSIKIVFCLRTSSSHYGAMRTIHATRMLDASNGSRSRFLPLRLRHDCWIDHSRLVLCKLHMSPIFI